MVAAMFLLRVEPGLPRFASDRGFSFELVRMWRAQTRLAFGSFYNEAKDCTNYVYKVLPERVTEYMADFIITTYSRFAARVNTAFEHERTWKAEHEQKLVEGFEGL